MMRAPVPDAVFEFGDFRFEPANSRLLRAGDPLHAQPKMLRVLAVLIENAGALVDREALTDLVWEGVVVTPGALTRLIRELRRLLDDDAIKPRFIETVLTRGYRWVSSVTRSGSTAHGSNLRLLSSTASRVDIPSRTGAAAARERCAQLTVPQRAAIPVDDAQGW